MKTLLIFAVFTYIINAVENSARPAKLQERTVLSHRKISVDSRPKEESRRRATTESIKITDGKDPLKKQTRKSDHYIDPNILKQLNGVKDLEDFVKKFKPKGFTIKKEKVLKKKTTLESKAPNKPVIGIAGVSVSLPDSSFVDSSLLAKGSITPDDVYEEVEEDTVYYQGQKIADPLQSSSVDESACIPRNITQSLERIGVVSYPPCVILKKCGGCCRNAKECVAVTIKNKTITVIEISATGYQVVSRTFTDDQTCGCDCIVKESDCLPTQTYSKDRCQCECQRSEQPCATGKHWSKAECNCICSNRQDCTSPVRKWDESSCSCVCIDTPCPTGQTRNQESCLCS